MAASGMGDRDSWADPSGDGTPRSVDPGMQLPPVLPGLVVRRRLGRGAQAPWVARSDDGTWVVARPGPAPSGLPDHPALLPVLGQVRDPAGTPWVVTPYRAGNGLDRRLARVGRLDPAAVRRCGASVAAALAALHDVGLAHGDVSPARVLLGPGDEAVLDATCAGAASAAARGADLAAFADLLDAVTGGTSAGSLAAAAKRARDGGTDAASLARDLRPGRDAAPRARHARAAHASRAVATALAVAGLLLAAGVLGVRLAGRPAPTASLDGPVALAVEESTHPSPAQSPTRSAEPEPADREPPDSQPADQMAATDWTGVLAELDRARGEAFEVADASLLAAVDAPGSVARRRDAALVGQLRDGGVVAEGWATRLLAVRPVQVTTGRAVLRVTDSMRAYVLRDAAGHVVQRRPSRAATDWTIRLVRTADGWRVASVR